jgi:hypothetical protein
MLADIMQDIMIANARPLPVPAGNSKEECQGNTKGKQRQLETDMELSAEEHLPKADDQKEADLQQAISASMSANI